MTAIPDFTEVGYKLTAALLFDRYGKLVPIQLANVSPNATTANFSDDDYHEPLVA